MKTNDLLLIGGAGIALYFLFFANKNASAAGSGGSPPMQGFTNNNPTVDFGVTNPNAGW